jgi:hypothetical protein
MGLACSLDIYQEKMSELFIDMTFVIVYQDDILVLTSGSFDDHLRQLSNVFKRLQHNNLQVNAEKSSFCALKTEYLGFILTREGIKPQQQKVNAILQVALPRNVKQVRSFVGMLIHYKAMIPRRSHLLTPLTALTKKNVKFEWTKEHQQAFDSLKNSLAREVVIAYPDFLVPFEIYTDASKYQIGSVITQKDKPLAFYSRKLTDPQTRYTVSELELLVIVETLREYKCILLGHLITIYMDHKNLTFSNFTTDRVTRWQLLVEEYGPILSTYLANAISLMMLSRAYQNSKIRMTNQYSLKRSLHSTSKPTYFQLPSTLFLKRNSPIRRFNSALHTMTQTSKQE